MEVGRKHWEEGRREGEGGESETGDILMKTTLFWRSRKSFLSSLISGDLSEKNLKTYCLHFTIMVFFLPPPVFPLPVRLCILDPATKGPYFLTSIQGGLQDIIETNCQISYRYIFSILNC